MFCFKDLYRYSYKTHHKSIISILMIGLNTEDIKLVVFRREDIKEVLSQGHHIGILKYLTGLRRSLGGTSP